MKLKDLYVHYTRSKTTAWVSGSGAFSRWFGEACGGHKLTYDPFPLLHQPSCALGATLRTHFPKLSKSSLLSYMTRITRMSTTYSRWRKLPCPEWHFSLSNTIRDMFGERNPMGKSDSLKRQKRLCLAQGYSYCRISHFQLNSQVLCKPDLWSQSDCPSSNSNRKVSRFRKDFTYNHRTLPVKGTQTRV